MGWDKGRGDKHRHPRLTLQVRQLICDKSEHIIPFLWKFNKDGLAEGTFLCGREGIGQLFGGGIDIFHDRDRSEETVSPADQLTAQKGGSNPSRQIQQKEETDEPQTPELVGAVKQKNVYIGDQGGEDAVQGVEDELQDEKGDPEGEDD